jgi:hypothetical protein
VLPGRGRLGLISSGRDHEYGTEPRHRIISQDNASSHQICIRILQVCTTTQMADISQRRVQIRVASFGVRGKRKEQHGPPRQQNATLSQFRQRRRKRKFKLSRPGSEFLSDLCI